MGYAEIVDEDGTVFDLEQQAYRRHAVISGGLPYFLIVVDPEAKRSMLTTFGIGGATEEVLAALKELVDQMASGEGALPGGELEVAAA